MTFAGLLLLIIGGAFILDHLWPIAIGVFVLAVAISALQQRGKHRPRPAKRPIERPVPKSDRRTPPRYVLPQRVKHKGVVVAERVRPARRSR